MQIWPGQPFPLGASYDGAGTNFSMFSEVADRVELCLFDDGANEMPIEVAEVDAGCWHAYLPGIGPGPALRLPRPRSLGPGCRSSLQPGQAPARPLRHRRRGRGRTGPRPCSPTASTIPTARPTTTTAPRTCRRGSSPARTSTGPTTATRTGRGTRRSSTRPTSRGSPPATRRSPKSCAAPTPGWPTRPPSIT